MPYNFVVDSIHTKKLCSRLSSSEGHRKQPFCVRAPFGGGCRPRATYDIHLSLIGKLVVDFLLVLIELFHLVLVLRLRRYARIWINNKLIR